MIWASVKRSLFIRISSILTLRKFSFKSHSFYGGITRRLLEFAENTASEAGFSHIRLYTNEAMTENLSLYQRIGYAETHRAEEKGLRRVYMVKTLPKRPRSP